MKNIFWNVDNIVQVEMEKFRTKLLDFPRSEKLYSDILTNVVWSDRR